MTERTKIILIGATLMALLLPALAQNSTAPPQPAVSTQTTSVVPESGKRVQERGWNQQDRIGNGVDSGQLTTGEATNLEKKESELKQEEHAMKAQDNGRLTTTDRSILQRQQNQLSNQIHKDEHNGSVQNTDPKNKVDRRAENQQDRIAQGIKSGRLNAGEAAHIEKQESALHQEVKAERQLNGGRLTQQERAQVNRQQNHVSKQIYKDKHNGRK
jgi:hypothetical protein